MERTAENLISIARAQLGYLEKASNNLLDSPAANGGNANYTKYSRDLWAAGYYNGNKQGQPWCDTFVDWLFWTLCDHNKAEAEAMECQSGELGAGCRFSRAYYQEQGRLFQTPRPGDQVFFRRGLEIYHTGIVTEVNGNVFRTIEGNTTDRVAEHRYTLDTSAHDFGRPRYGEEAAAQTVKPQEKPQESAEEPKRCTYMVELPLLLRGSEGAAVKAVQLLLLGRGISVGRDGADGDFGRNTYQAVRKFQQLCDLEDDGVVGGETWAALLTR